MKVLVACEFSGIVRDAFKDRGHDAWSCDILPTDKPGQHIQGDALELPGFGWDMMIAHPPCTYLTVTGNKWFFHPDDKDLPPIERRPHPRFPNRQKQKKDAADFFMSLANAPIKKICIENPVGYMSSIYQKPTQIIHPWQFGHEKAKRTCLWLKNLPSLTPTNIVPKGEYSTQGKNRMPQWYVDAGKIKDLNERKRLRSVTFQGIANAMAEQWG